MTKSTKETIVNPPLLPPMNHGMRELNRALFKAKVPTFGIKMPLKSIGQYLKKIDVDLLNQPKLRNLTEYDANHKLLLLKAACYKDGELDKSILSETTLELVNQPDTELFKHEIDLTYEYWPSEAVLKSVFPPEIQVPTSFSTIGHIAHFNLKPEHDDYKKILGQVILDKNPNIKTVVNKLDTIDNTFRNFKMELLAGEDNMIAEVRENTCRFKLDFSKVYWNSRLHAEHERLIDSFGSEALVCDGFAGIGPFAIPAAKKGCTVYANDLNPESVKWLRENIKLNKLNKKVETIFASQGSAADFFPEAFTKLIDNQLKESSTEGSVKVFDHAVMNLPATAIEFLGSFKGCITNETLPESITNKCTIHCHSFSKAENALEDLVDRASHYLGFALDASECSAHWVRSVAPNKDMYCLSFAIPNEYLCKTTCDSVIDSRPVTKKIKLDTNEDKAE